MGETARATGVRPVRLALGWLLKFALALPSAACADPEARADSVPGAPATHAPVEERADSEVPVAPGAAKAPPASAGGQASVQLSGEVNLALVRLHGAGGAPTSSVLRMDSTNSRIVFRGREPLSQGWESGFLLSNGFHADAGGGTICGRECTLTLAGPWARVKLGRQLDVYDDVSLAWYYQDAAGNHNPLALWANCGDGAGLPEGCVDNYISSSVRVDTTPWHGLSGSGFFAQPVAGRQNAFIGAAGLQWQSNKAYAGLAFQRQANVRSPRLAESAVTASAGLTQGRWYVALAAEHLSYDTLAGTVARDYGGMLVKYAVAGDVGTLWVNFGVAGSAAGSAPDGMAVNAVRIGPGTGALMWTVGYSQRLGALTRLYAYFNEIDDQRAATYAFDTQLAAAYPYRRQNALALGMSHRF